MEKVLELTFIPSFLALFLFFVCLYRAVLMSNFFIRKKKFRNFQAYYPIFLNLIQVFLIMTICFFSPSFFKNISKKVIKSAVWAKLAVTLLVTSFLFPLSFDRAFRVLPTTICLILLLNLFYNLVFYQKLQFFSFKSLVYSLGVFYLLTSLFRFFNFILIPLNVCLCFIFILLFFDFATYAPPLELFCTYNFPFLKTKINV